MLVHIPIINPCHINVWEQAYGVSVQNIVLSVHRKSFYMPHWIALAALEDSQGRAQL